jgi:tetratricopeptide (TPR) repeat protein/TolB-like protein
MSTIRPVLQEVARRNLWQVLGIYVGGAWVLLQVLDLFIDRGFVPEWVFRGALALVLLGLPVMLTTAWVQGGRMGLRVPRPDAPEDTADLDTAGLLTWSRALTGGVLAFALLGFVTAGWMLMRVIGIGSPATLAARGVLEVGSRLVLADFESSAQDAAPSDLVTEALRIDLAQSSAIRLVGAQEVTEALALMRRDRLAPLTEDVAREVAVRLGAAAVISGEIGRLGSGFVLNARVLEAPSGSVLAPFRVTATHEDDLINAIDGLSSRIRSKIGESLRSVAASEPLPSVTTQSLEALKLFATVSRGANTGSIAPSVAQGLLQEALARDSTFAMAHRALSVQISNYGGDREVGARAAAAAFRHRGRLPDRERLIVEAYYYAQTQGDYRRTIETHRRLLALDSLDGYTAVIIADALLYAGEYEEAERVLWRLPLWDTRPWAWNLTVAYAAQNRLEDALAVRDTFGLRGPIDPYAKSARAILLLSAGEIERARAVLEGEPETAGPGRAYEIYDVAVLGLLTGRLDAAAEGFRAMHEHLERDVDFAPSDRILMGMAWPWALSWIVEEHERAATEVDTLLRQVDVESLSPFNREYPLLALTYAMIGERPRAIDALARYRAEVAHVPDAPSESRAGIAEALLGIQGSGATGIPALEAAVRRMRCARCRDFFLGHGHELAGQARQAAEAYERFLAQPFFNANDFITHIFSSAMHERLGRLYDELGEAAHASEHYGRFAEVWADADPALQPRVRLARERAAALTVASREPPRAAQPTSTASVSRTEDVTSPSALPAGDSGADTTVGAPASPASRMAGSSGTRPRNGTFISSARSLPPPEPKTSIASPQCGQVSPLMFSTMPSTRVFTLSNIFTPRRTSPVETSWGVVTMTAPSRLIVCTSESCASPVPGGMSTTITSSAPQSTCSRNCFSTPEMSGPRMMAGCSLSSRKPRLMSRTPCASSGTIISLPFSPVTRGR